MGGKQKPGFLKRLHALKQEELNNMVDDAQLPLRTGACFHLLLRLLLSLAACVQKVVHDHNHCMLEC